MKHKMLLLLFLLAAIGVMAQKTTRVHPKTCIKVESETTLDITGGNLILESDATGDASLIDIGSVTYSGGGEVIVERYLTEGLWHLISSPVNTALSGMFMDDYLQYYQESTDEYFDIPSTAYQLKLMQGYALWTVDTEPSTEVFSGTTNTGNLSKTFTQDGEGWNLMGNPYPSALDWDAVTIPPELNAAILLFDPTSGSNGDYRYYMNGGGDANTTSRYIPSGQGFFVRATGGAGTLSLDNSSRVHGGQVFYKNTEDEVMLVLKATGNGITTQTAIRFNSNATSGPDRLYDVFEIISGSPEVPNLYTKCEDEKMAINTFPSISKHETVPAYFEAGMNGTYSILASELNFIPAEVPVFLEDIALNLFHDFRAEPEYVFIYQSGEVKNFRIHFKDVTGIEAFENSGQANIQCYLSSNKLHVNFMGDDPEYRTNANLEVYAITGQLIVSRQIPHQKNEIAFNGSQSAYIIRITTNHNIYSSKIFNH